MKKFKLLTAFLLTVCFVFTAAGCSDKKKETPESPSVDEINKEYDEAISSSDSYETLPEDYNPIVSEFTNTDFQFTWLDNTNAFNLPYNAYARILPEGATVSFLNGSTEPVYFEGTYQNAKGYSFSNTREEIVAAYNVGADNLYMSESGAYLFGFASTDGVQYSILSSSDVQAVASSAASGINPVDAAGGYQTIAVIELFANEAGLLGEYKIYCYSSVAHEEKFDH